MARCTRANIHPSRIPLRALSPLHAASAPFILRVASRRVASFASSRRHALGPRVLREIWRTCLTDYLRLETGLREDTGDRLSPLERVARIAEEVRVSVSLFAVARSLC